MMSFCKYFILHVSYYHYQVILSLEEEKCISVAIVQNTFSKQMANLFSTFKIHIEHTDACKLVQYYRHNSEEKNSRWRND